MEQNIKVGSWWRNNSDCSMCQVTRLVPNDHTSEMMVMYRRSHPGLAIGCCPITKWFEEIQPGLKRFEASILAPEPTVITPEDRATLRLMCQGASNKDLARKFGLTEEGIKGRVKRLMQKTGESRRTGLVTWAVFNGIYP